MEITDIKTRLSIETVLTRYNLKPDRYHKLCCPFHEEKTPSFTIYPKTNTFHCFGCDISGDTIEFIQLKENITKHEAILRAQEFIGVPPMLAEVFRLRSWRAFYFLTRANKVRSFQTSIGRTV